MTITRKQLELAAKAAGLELYESNALGLCVKLKAGQLAYDVVKWRPLTDHGQLLDLAMACRVCIDPRDNSIEYKLTPDDHYSSGKYVNCQDFPSLSEAVILAASEMEQQLAKEEKA